MTTMTQSSSSELCKFIAVPRGDISNSNASAAAIAELTAADNSSFSKVNPDPLLESVKFVLAGVVNPALCLFGLVGNVFNVLVLSRRRMKAAMDCTAMEQAAHVGLIALAVSDALYCISSLFDALVSRSQTMFRREEVVLMYAQIYGPYLQNTFMHTGSWLTVIMAAGRYAAICRPLHARYLLGVRSTVLAVTTTFAIWTFLELPVVWTFEVFELNCDNETLYILDEGLFVVYGKVKIAFTYVWSVLGFVLPVVTLTYCNIHLIRALRESHRMRRQYRVSARTATSCGSRVTPTLVAVVCMYIVLITPGELLQFYFFTVKEEEAVEMLTTAIVATNVLQTLNFAFNFVLYCIVNVHFRETWKELVYCSICRRSKARSRAISEFEVLPVRQQSLGNSVCLSMSMSSPASVGKQSVCTSAAAGLRAPGTFKVVGKSRSRSAAAAASSSSSAAAAASGDCKLFQIVAK